MRMDFHGPTAAVADLVDQDRCLRTLIQRLRETRVGTCVLILPDGTSRRFMSGKQQDMQATLRLVDPAAVSRLFLGGAIGFARAYIDGQWETPDLPGLLLFASANEGVFADVAGRGCRGWLGALRSRWGWPDTRWQRRRNVSRHYDLGNSFYRLWLDPGMTYSSALFETPQQSLEAAQANKYRRLAQVLELRRGLDLLDLGCGWGAFALLAAGEYGCRVTAVTLSTEQEAWMRSRAAEAGLAHRIGVRLQDYGDVTGSFDRIASIEVIEAAGERGWPRFFAKVRRLLRPDGIAALQFISVDEQHFPRYRRHPDFIRQHIFPGGLLPTSRAIDQAAVRAGLQMTARFTFGGSYAATLAQWRQAFEDAEPQVAALGFDARFIRMWRYYLAYCEAGFRSGNLDVQQVALVHAPTLRAAGMD